MQELGVVSVARPAICLLGHTALGRRAYRLLLQEDLGYEVTVDADFTPVSVWNALRSKPDLVLVEADAPRPEVIDAVQMATRLRPEARILAISGPVDPLQVEPWSRCRLDGYVVKDANTEELRNAIQSVSSGGEYFSPGIREALSRSRYCKNGPARLSPREAQLLPLLARGMTLREAASAMEISYKTADSYRTTLLRKLGLRDRVELARYAIRQRIIDP